jgi:DNA-binding NtrC family response regulator
VESELPSLRERAEDVPALAQRFLEDVTERLGRGKKRLSESALAALVRHPWPGNVRELRNAIEQAAVLAPGPNIEEEDLALGGGTRPGGAPPSDLSRLPFGDAKRQAVEGFERAYLLRALRAHDGNISRTAEAIGMVRQSLQQKIRELGLRDEDWTNGD